MRKFWCFFRVDSINESQYILATNAEEALFEYIRRHRNAWINREVGAVGWGRNGKRAEIVWATT